MNTYQDFLNAPCKVINLKKNTERWETTQKRLNDIGFSNFERFEAYGQDRLKEGWDKLNNPKIAEHTKDLYFYRVAGKQGCFLSHVLIWKEMIDNNTPYMTIFEDDVLFHHLWDTLAPTYFEKTPSDYDLLYLGSQIQGESKFHIDQVPVYCTHAYIITLEGAKKLYDLIINEPYGMYTIDGMLIDLMHAKRFNWYIWNGSFYPPEKKMAEGWNVRNNGLVYQDENFGTDIMNYI